MDGCAPSPVLGTKKDDLLPPNVVVEPLSLAKASLASIESISKKDAYSALFAIASHFFFSFALIESWAALIILGVTFLQSSTS